MGRLIPSCISDSKEMETVKRKKKNTMVCILTVLLLTGGLLLSLFLPESTYSDSERRSLAVMPGLSWDGVWSGRFMSGFEAHVTDTFPFRNSLRSVKALTATGIFRRQDNNGMYVSQGYISAMEYPVEAASLRRCAERFGYICETYLTEENQVFLSVIPDKNAFLAQESGHPAADYGAIEKQMEDMADYAQYIPVSDLLEKADYYRTDPHWRQERILDVAERLAGSMGTELSDEWEMHTLERDFYGAYYGQAALPLPPDDLYYLTGASTDGCQVYDWQNGKAMPVYDMEKAMGRDPYEMFLSGSLSLITIENPQATRDKKLILFRDSFGSALAPLLISGYREITLVDIRYIHPDHLGQFVDFEGCDVLFLYSTLVLGHGEMLK